ncbi:hypothetical protein NKH18_26605 [Streptomyces sp. M10(2022)]
MSGSAYVLEVPLGTGSGAVAPAPVDAVTAPEHPAPDAPAASRSRRAVRAAGGAGRAGPRPMPSWRARWTGGRGRRHGCGRADRAPQGTSRNSGARGAAGPGADCGAAGRGSGRRRGRHSPAEAGAQADLSSQGAQEQVQEQVQEQRGQALALPAAASSAPPRVRW